MNTIKFTKMFKTATERHDPNNEKALYISLSGEERIISVPLNLNILITYNCNCSCDFCLVKQERKLPVISNQLYLTQLEQALKQLQGIPIEITITGGEPTLCPERLIPVLDLLKRYNIPHRTFSTNGTGLLNCFQNKPILQHMKEAGAGYNINLSRMYMEESINQKLMKGNTVSISDMKQIASFCDVNDMDIRISCNLMKNGVADFDSMKEYIKSVELLGFDNVIFRELVNYEKEFVCIIPIMEQIKAYNVFHYIKTLETNQYKIDIYQYQSYIVKLYQTDKKTKRLTNLVYREGLLSDSWDIDHFYEVRG